MKPPGIGRSRLRGDSVPEWTSFWDSKAALATSWLFGTGAKCAAMVTGTPANGTRENRSRTKGAWWDGDYLIGRSDGDGLDRGISRVRKDLPAGSGWVPDAVSVARNQ